MPGAPGELEDVAAVADREDCGGVALGAATGQAGRQKRVPAVTGNPLSPTTLVSRQMNRKCG